MNRERAADEARVFFEGLWRQGDFWNFAASDFERARYRYLIDLLANRRYGRVLELGCGAGDFTVMLAGLADHTVAVDIAEPAIARARARGLPSVEFRVANIMDLDVRAEGPLDLIVFSDTICYLGWLYPFFDVAWMATELFAATADGGRLLLANAQFDEGEALMQPAIIRTYHDMFRNVGYCSEREDVFRGTKNGVQQALLVSLLTRPGARPV